MPGRRSSAFLTGRGWSSEAIADRLADGTSSATIRSMWASWEISGAETALTIPLSVRERANIQARAAQHGISAEEYCHRIVVGASMPRDRYQDIVGSDT
jgi:hypothetical protein